MGKGLGGPGSPPPPGAPGGGDAGERSDVDVVSPGCGLTPPASVPQPGPARRAPLAAQTEGPPGAPRTCDTWFPGARPSHTPAAMGVRETGVGGLFRAIMGLEEFPFI